MPRRKRTKIERLLLIEGWKSFGLWLESQRLAKRLTQQQAAEAVGVSKRQWIRYEMGSRVLLKRMRPIAYALSVPERRILYLAGYKISPRLNDASHQLRRMHDMLLAGSLDIALQEFLSLYERIRPTDRQSRSDFNGLTAPNFASAIIFLERLPNWLLAETIKAMQERTSGGEQNTDTHARSKNLIRKKCVEALRNSEIGTRPGILFVAESVGPKEQHSPYP
jgi:transcriptional regulator with XRE-family HTH domain